MFRNKMQHVYRQSGYSRLGHVVIWRRNTNAEVHKDMDGRYYSTRCDKAISTSNIILYKPQHSTLTVYRSSGRWEFEDRMPKQYETKR
ncbi:cytochrome p450 [Moniliophthora roreri]|nr:cytochrome p450 [Moniliophthora roreri]